MDHHLYISPHLDDAVFSCGGYMLQQSAAGDRVTVLTVFAGDPPQGSLSSFAQQLHNRWGIGREGVSFRRAEDRVACARVDATAVHLEYPEAIYRTAGCEFLYHSEEAIFGDVHPRETVFEEELLAALRERTHPSMRLYAPLGLGGHVDHRLVRRVVDTLNLPLIFYPDFPYAARGETIPSGLEVEERGKTEIHFQPEEIEEWASVICEYGTQLSTFWPSYDALIQEMEAYLTERAVMTLYSSDPIADY